MTTRQPNTSVAPAQYALAEVRRLLSAASTPLTLSELTAICRRCSVRGHLAVFREPYLGQVINGTKQLECRFSRHRVAPYREVEIGDVIFLKAQAGHIVAVVAVTSVSNFGPLCEGEAQAIMEEFRDALKIDLAFIEMKRESMFGTVMKLGELMQVEQPGIPVKKNDRRGWVVLNASERHGQ